MGLESFNPLQILVILVAVTLLPFMAVIATSFAKIIVVLGILRNALGLQSTPPSIVLNGLALILTFFIMTPTISETYGRITQVNLSNVTMTSLGATMSDIGQPFIKFLNANSKQESKEFFLRLAKRTWPASAKSQLDANSFMIALPAFVISELTQAFQIGFIIYLPFVVIDLVVSNILLALGMMMVSPTTISLPFKLLLFTLVDGWVHLLEGLTLTYHL